MGSITSVPKIPAAQQPQPVYIPVPTPVYTSMPALSPASSSTSSSSAGSGTGSSGNSGGASSSPPPPVTIPAASQGNLLQRSRGVFSTVLTGFRGLLGDSILAAPRKTLLGE